MFVRKAMILILLLFLSCPTVAGTDLPAVSDTPSDPGANDDLDSAIGSADPYVLERLARNIATKDLIAAVYSPKRSQRLIAIQVAGRLDNPWPLLPYLAALMKAPQRDVCSRAAESLWTSLERLNRRWATSSEYVPGEIEYIAAILKEVAMADQLEPDTRVIAMDGIGLLYGIVGRQFKLDFELLEDAEPQVRAGFLGVLLPPFKEETLNALARVVSEDPSWILRGQAAALLCENALSHGVDKPTKDLESLLGSVMVQEAPEEAIGPILACLKRFSTESRRALVERALSLQKIKVQLYWDELTN